VSRWTVVLNRVLTVDHFESNSVCDIPDWVRGLFCLLPWVTELEEINMPDYSIQIKGSSEISLEFYIGKETERLKGVVRQDQVPDGFEPK
jgi:hypothetical protein